MKTATKTARLTTNIDARLLQFLDEWAKAEDRTRREMLELIVAREQKAARAAKLLKEYNEMADDPEMQMWLDIANAPENLKIVGEPPY